MKQKHFLILIIIAVICIALLLIRRTSSPAQMQNAEAGKETYWKSKLTDQQYYVLRQGGTDTPFTSPEMLHEKRKGTYVTADCGEPVFRSEKKFDSGTGWPSFSEPVNPESVILKSDTSFGTVRVEVLGKKCGTHLGHVFDDGPTVFPDGTKATGKRYCINASALTFIPDKEQL